MKIFDFIVHSSIYLAFGGACLVYASCLLFGVEPKIELILIMFLGIYAIYNFSRITDRAEDEINVPDRVLVFTRYEKYLTISIPIAYLSAILLAYYIGGIKLAGVVLGPLILILLYAVKWIPKSISKHSRLKEVVGVKNIVASLAWAWIATLLPFVYLNLDSTTTLWVIFIFIFIRWIINTIFFDFKDVEGDKTMGIITLPIFFSVHRTLILLATLNTLLGIFIIISTLKGWLPPLAHLVNLSTIYCYIYLYLYNKVDIKFLSNIIVDGEYIVMGVLAFLGALLL